MQVDNQQLGQFLREDASSFMQVRLLPLRELGRLVWSWGCSTHQQPY